MPSPRYPTKKVATYPLNQSPHTISISPHHHPQYAIFSLFQYPHTISILPPPPFPPTPTLTPNMYFPRHLTKITPSFNTHTLSIPTHPLTPFNTPPLPTPLSLCLSSVLYGIGFNLLWRLENIVSTPKFEGTIRTHALNTTSYQ